MAGYGKFANLMGEFPELTIFRRFGALNAKLLLYRQAELVRLEDDLKFIAQEDEKHADTKEFGKSWHKMHEASSEFGANQQREKVHQIEEKLKTYCEFRLLVCIVSIGRLNDADRMLCWTAEVYRLRKPADSDLSFLQRWLRHRDGGDNFLKDLEADPWELEYTQDLLVLSDKDQRDRLARYLGDKLGLLYHKCWGYHTDSDIDPEKGLGRIWEYKHKNYVLIGNALCVILSTFIPVTSLFSLSSIQDILYRLLMITCLTLLFSSVLMFVVGCRRFDVFAGTAAFAAVQVVFVQGGQR